MGIIRGDILDLNFYCAEIFLYRYATLFEKTRKFYDLPGKPTAIITPLCSIASYRVN